MQYPGLCVFVRFRVHILPVRYELVEWEVVVVERFDLIVICDVVSPWWGNDICLAGLGCRSLVA